MQLQCPYPVLSISVTASKTFTERESVGGGVSEASLKEVDLQKGTAGRRPSKHRRLSPCRARRGLLVLVPRREESGRPLRRSGGRRGRGRGRRARGAASRPTAAELTLAGEAEGS